MMAIFVNKNRMYRRAAIGLGLFLASTGAAAQNGAMWLDDKGRMMSMQFAGGSGAAPVPVDRSAADMAGLFKRLCVDTNGEPAAIDASSAKVDASLVSEPFTMAGGKKARPVELNLWKAPGLVVARTPGFFAAPVAQCNANFYVNTLPEAQMVTDALGAALGGAPLNAADAVKKNGKPNKHFVPEWAVGDKLVSVHVAKGNQFMPGDRVQIAIRSRKKAG